jgi:hypothetical protein
MARLMTGDAAGAEAIFAEYETASRAAHDPVIDLTRARWDYLRGERAAAIQKMQSFDSTSKIQSAAGVADCTLTVWLLNAGDLAGAAKHPVCRFLLDKNSPSFPNPLMRAYTLLFAKDYEQAAQVLRELLSQTAPSPTDPTPALLAWALVETGHFDEAEKYLQTVPTPATMQPDPFESLVYPRIIQLRAQAAGKKTTR